MGKRREKQPINRMDEKNRGGKTMALWMTVRRRLAAGCVFTDDPKREGAG